jgi:APA family basic amino acid/polyamine antiporter
VPAVPLLGVLLCLVLMFSLPSANWLRLFVWMSVGIIIYFLYGRHHSVMARHHKTAAHPAHKDEHPK